MRKSITYIILLVSIVLISSAQTRIFPEAPSAWVNDYAGILSHDEAESLNTKLGYYEDSTSTQIFVVTLDETHGAEISALAAEIGETWGVGQKGKENGLIILTYPSERKIFIATGYGLEEYVPDIAIRKIIDAEITPAFRNGDYYGGLDKATDVIMGLLSGKFTADHYSSSKSEGIPVIGIVLLFIILMLIFRSRPGNHKTLIRDIPFWMAMGMLNGSRNSHGGSFGGFNSGSGGFGGFSGGGGGSFGGGGAGGSW